MMTIRKQLVRYALIGLGCVTLSAGVAKAEDFQEDRSVTFGPRGEYFKAKDADDGEWSGGAQLRLFFNDALALEGSVDYRREKFGDTRVDIYPVQASLLAYLIPTRPIGLFLLGGAGWYYTRIDPPSPADDDTDHRFGLHAGGGVELALNDRWSIDGTYRYIWLDKFETQDDDLEDKEFDDSGYMITAALNYNF